MVTRSPSAIAPEVMLVVATEAPAANVKVPTVVAPFLIVKIASPVAALTDLAEQVEGFAVKA